MNNVKQMNLFQIILYHLLPGVPILLFAGLFSFGLGMDMTLGFIFAIALGLIPTQLLIIFFTAKRQNTAIKEIISYTEKISFAKFILWVLPCILIGWLVFWFFKDIEQSFWNNLIGSAETEVYLEKVSNTAIPLFVIILTYLFNGFLGPIVEEIYFRGFLLPRMNKLGKAAPAVNTILFSLYHLFSPMEIITRILGLAPFTYAVWYKKNIYIGIVVHCSLNLIGMTVSLFLI